MGAGDDLLVDSCVHIVRCSSQLDLAESNGLHPDKRELDGPHAVHLRCRVRELSDVVHPRGQRFAGGRQLQEGAEVRACRLLVCGAGDLDEHGLLPGHCCGSCAGARAHLHSGRRIGSALRSRQVLHVAGVRGDRNLDIGDDRLRVLEGVRRCDRRPPDRPRRPDVSRHRLGVRRRAQLADHRATAEGRDGAIPLAEDPPRHRQHGVERRLAPHCRLHHDASAGHSVGSAPDQPRVHQPRVLGHQRGRGREPGV
mmetsp:Transcript_40858/g.117378  ORF Transcript_40858/g.117378 Transcript_40858/m.117378 type:complete len:254 (+) Transcript_40858:1368-2129(+)